MLAQNFKSANDLNLTEQEWMALVKTLKLLETDRLIHMHSPMCGHHSAHFTGHFNMSSWNITTAAAGIGCCTVGCIGGTAEMIGGLRLGQLESKSALDERLSNLFYPTRIADWGAITPAQAAVALRSYLTTGDARWDLVP